MLKHHMDSCKKNCSTVDDIVQHLRDHHPNYRRMELKTLTRLVSQVLRQEPSPHHVHNKKHGVDGDEDEKSLSALPRKRRKRIDEEGDLGTTTASGSDGESEFYFKSMLESELESESNVEIDGKKVEFETCEIQEQEGEIKSRGHGNMAGEVGPMFKDLGGMDGLLEKIKRLLLPFYYPEIPKRIGVKHIRGILLHGPPGCGKTMLAHAIANEMGVPFYKISATEVVSGVSGESEENIREVFNKAYRTEPSIIFIDEIDTIGSKRENLQRQMEKRIVTELMNCMDSNYRRTGRVLVIGATNMADALDPALRRPGRFDREFNLGIPDENARAEILSNITKNCRLEGPVDLLQIARSTPGYVGADLNALVEEAGKCAMSRIFLQGKCQSFIDEEWLKRTWSCEDIEKLAITMTDFEKSIREVQPSSLREGFSTVPNVTWEDVGGLDDIKRVFELHIIRRVKYPDKYKKLGLNSGTGILMYGPTGCGKTLIAEAVANEAGANFIHVKGPEILSKYVGESESAIRTIFSRARKCSPCVLFFDEIDALTTQRGKEGAWVVERLVNQLLAEWNGTDRQAGVYIIGATNRPEVIDTALVRSGRFGQHVYVPLPSPEDRVSILKTLARGRPIDPNVDLDAIARMEACEKFNGADLKELMELAALAVVEEGTVSQLCDDEVLIKAAHFEQTLNNLHSTRNGQREEHEKEHMTARARANACSW